MAERVNKELIKKGLDEQMKDCFNRLENAVKDGFIDRLISSIVDYDRIIREMEGIYSFQFKEKSSEYRKRVLSIFNNLKIAGRKDYWQYLEEER